MRKSEQAASQTNRLNGQLEGIGEHRPGPKRDKPIKLSVPQPKIDVLRVTIRGTSPLIIRAWDQKTAQQLADKAAGKKKTQDRENVDPEETLNNARYISTEGWDGIPAGAFKAAMCEAVSCLDIPIKDFNMKLAKKSIFVNADGICKVSGRDLVRINGKAEMFKIMQPTSGGGPYMSYRPRYPEWECELLIRFNATKIDGQGIMNLLATAGYFVGVGEHRPSAKESMTGTSGLFKVLETR